LDLWRSHDTAIILITPEQIRAARALLRLEQGELARRAQVSVVTIRRLEAPNGLTKVAPGTVDEVQRALEAAGAEFVDRGVRRRPRTAAEIEALRRKIHAIVERSVAMQAKLPPFTENDLYDENGL
jgi:transcriptional regulator with XRE-family HTH domain